MATTPEGPPPSVQLEGIQLSDVGADQLSPLLDMMQDFNSIEDIPWSRQDAEPAVLRLLDSPELGVIAHILEAGTLRGYVVLTWGYDLEWGGRDAFLTELYLLPAARGRGLGRRALPLIEEQARRRGARALHLMVRPENQAALQLYRGAGYSSPPRTFLTKDLGG
jgi:ribosomal protein S18 acetylase RimI-like enzyme